MRSVLLLAVLVSLTVVGTAGADEIYLPDNNATAGQGNVIPFGGVWPSSNTNGEFTYQWFIPAAMLGGRPFRLTGIANAPCRTGVHTAAQAEILIGHNGLAAYSTTFAQNLPQPTTLYPLGPWTWNVTANQWEAFPLPGGATYNYNGNDNLCIQIRLNGSASTVQGFAYLDCWNDYNSPSRVYKYGVGAFNATTGSSSAGYSGKIRLTISYVSIVGSGAPRPGGKVDLALLAPGDAGLPYQVGTSFGTGPIVFGSRSLKLSPDDLLMLSVNNLLPSVFQNYSGFLDTQGQGKATIMIPNIPALVGVSLHSAFVTLKAGEPFNLKTISDTFSFKITT